MTQRELCARNVSSALREAANAENCAAIDGAAARGWDSREIDDATLDLLAQARECLERAAERLSRPREKKPEAPKAEAPAAPAAAAK